MPDNHKRFVQPVDIAKDRILRERMEPVELFDEPIPRFDVLDIRPPIGADKHDLQILASVTWNSQPRIRANSEASGQLFHIPSNIYYRIYKELLNPQRFISQSNASTRKLLLESVIRSTAARTDATRFRPSSIRRPHPRGGSNTSRAYHPRNGEIYFKALIL